MSNKDLSTQAKEALSVKLETSEEYATRLLNDGRFAQQQKRDNSELYQAGRRDQVRLNLRDDNIHDRLKGVRRAWDTPREYSQQELAARSTFSPALVDEWYSAAHSGRADRDLQQLKKDDPATYNVLRLAAASYGKIGVTVEQVLAEQPKPATANPDELLPVPEEMLTTLNLPADTRLNEEGFDRALKVFVETKAKQMLAAEKTAAESAEAQGAANGANAAQ